jgi:hypothetical protein
MYKRLLVHSFNYLLGEGVGVGVTKIVAVGLGFGTKESRGSFLGEVVTTATTPIRSKLLTPTTSAF